MLKPSKAEQKRRKKRIKELKEGEKPKRNIKLDHFWVKGQSGNPKGRPKGTTKAAKAALEKAKKKPSFPANPGGRPKEIKELARYIRDNFGLSLVEEAWRLFKSRHTPANVKFQLLNLLIERGWGKSPQYIHVDTESRTILALDCLTDDTVLSLLSQIHQTLEIPSPVHPALPSAQQKYNSEPFNAEYAIVPEVQSERI
jgi:hypothetical protein